MYRVVLISCPGPRAPGLAASPDTPDVGTRGAPGRELDSSVGRGGDG